VSLAFADRALQAPVAIVGGGPVGLMLALMLDLHNVRSVLFNTEETTRWHPKGSSQGARTMEHFRRLGNADKVRALGLPVNHATDVIYFTRFGGWEPARLRMPSAAEKIQAVVAAPKTDQVPEPLHRANQMYVEKFLLEHVRRQPNIVVRFGRQLPDVMAMMVAAARRKIPLAILDVADADARDLYQCDLALVRPDQYVAWRGNQTTADPNRLFARLAGANN